MVFLNCFLFVFLCFLTFSCNFFNSICSLLLIFLFVSFSLFLASVHFVSIIYLIIYLVGIAILFVFTILLLNLRNTSFKASALNLNYCLFVFFCTIKILFLINFFFIYYFKAFFFLYFCFFNDSFLFVIDVLNFSFMLYTKFFVLFLFSGYFLLVVLLGCLNIVLTVLKV